MGCSSRMCRLLFYMEFAIPNAPSCVRFTFVVYYMLYRIQEKRVLNPKGGNQNESVTHWGKGTI